MSEWILKWLLSENKPHYRCNICFWEALGNIHDNGVLIVID